MFKKKVELKVSITDKDTNKKAKVNHELSKMRKFFHKLAGAFALPIIVMSFAGLFLGLGAFMITFQEGKTGFTSTNHTLRIMGEFIANIGKPIFLVMPIFFAMAIVIVFTESAGISVFSVVLAYLTFLILQSTFIDDQAWQAAQHGKKILGSQQPNFLFARGAKFDLKNPENIYQTVLGIKSLKTGIFGAIVVGIVSSSIFNLFSKTKMPRVFSYFAGKRFVPIISIVAMIPLAIIFIIIWPYVGKGIEKLATLMINLNTKPNLSKFSLGSATTGLFSRLLMPFGLHDIFTQNIFSLLNPATIMNGVSIPGTIINGTAIPTTIIPSIPIHPLTHQFFQGQYPLSILILPAAAAAMVFAAPKGNRIVAFGAVLPAIVTCILTGITEPLEFALLFMAPFVFIFFQGLVTAAAFWAVSKFGGNIQNFVAIKGDALGVKLHHVNTTFVGGGLMDLIAVILNKKNVLEHDKWWLIFAVGGILAPITALGWFGFIRLLKLPTPGNIVPTALHTQEINIKSSLAQINKVPDNQKQIFRKLKKANKAMLKEIEQEKEIIAENEEIKKAKQLQKEEVKKAKEVQKKSIEKAKKEFQKVAAKTPEEVRAANLRKGRAIRRKKIAKQQEEKEVKKISSKQTDHYFIQKTKDGTAWELIKKNAKKNTFQDKKQSEVVRYAKAAKTLKNKNVAIKKADGKISKRIIIK